MKQLSRHFPLTLPLRGWPSVGALCFLLVAFGIWCGCTVTRENYHTLSFFFDGVPDPDGVKPGGIRADEATASEKVTVHPPFATEKCEACHRNSGRPSRNDPKPCLVCHTKITTEHEWTHGAVAGGACLWCHMPHESPRKWLFRNQDRKVCMQCHAATMLNGNVVPAHIDSKVGCLDCHFGHGGKDSMMLRPGASAKSPPPRPDPTAKDPAPLPKPGEPAPVVSPPPFSPNPQPADPK